MAHRYFEGKAHAMIYAKYRPLPPTSLIERIISFLKEKCNSPLDLAVDVGCGSGQSTEFFAPYFKRVIGTDISQSQIAEAKSKNKIANISYQVLPSEKLPSENATVNLITASQAAHWFDLPKFYDEGKRALAPGGVMALLGYEFPKFISANPQKNQELYKSLDKLYSVDLKGCWAPERKLVDNRYIDYKIPYDDFTRDDSFYHEMETRVSDLGGYVQTWSGFQNFSKKHGEEEAQKLVDNFIDRIMQILDTSSTPENTIITKRTSFFLLMARKSI